ncbi:MAG TPA: methyltransferase domain-containing protein [Burkholderiales bacterium]|nr:methyltransferase domain-containing protein [Burkholderiales bacterium]
MAGAALISEDYRKMQQELHRNPNYGVASVEYAPIVAQVMKAMGFNEILDYGAGKGRLGQTLDDMHENPLIIHHYDPAIPQWSQPPQPCNLVACIDVLEHIEPDLIDNVLDDLKRVTSKVGVFTVHTGAAVKVLADGRNAHLIQQPASWWLPRFMERFELNTFNRMPQGFWVVVERKA